MWQSDAAPEGRAPKTLPAQQRKQQASAPAIIQVGDKGNQFAESPLLVLRLEIQLHGCEAPERVAQIARTTGRRVMKAIKVETAADATVALGYRGAADLILFDAKAPAGAMLPGGNGIAFDWRTLAGVTPQLGGKWMLSGGLTPDNVAEAVRLTGAPAVDVSSGVELAPGEKSPELIRRFLLAAKTAKQNG